MDHKKALLQIVGGVAFLVVLSFVLSFFARWYYSAAFLCVVNLCILLYTRSFGVFKWLKNCATIFAISLVILFLHTLGWWGWLGTIIFITIWFLYSRWDVYMKAKHDVERQLFGKPIHQFKLDGERVPKVKFKWR